MLGVDWWCTRLGTVVLFFLSYPGSILTMADAKTKFISLLGPVNTASFLESTRYYIGRFDLDFKVTEFETSGDAFVEKDVKIVPIVLNVPREPVTDAFVSPAAYEVGPTEKPLRVSCWPTAFNLP